MATFRESLLATVESIRGSIPGQLDLRPRSVTVRVRTWSGARPGVGTFTDVDTLLLNAGYNVKVEQVATKDIVASGGKYQSGDYKIGRLTPTQYALDASDPATTTTAREVFYIIRGPGLPAAGLVCKRVSDDSPNNFHFNVVVRVMAVQP